MKENETHIDDSICQHPASRQSPIYSLPPSMPSEKIMCTDVWVLRDLVKAFRGEDECGWILQLVEYELDDLVLLRGN